jgi:hypothetical protein
MKRRHRLLFCTVGKRFASKTAKSPHLPAVPTLDQLPQLSLCVAAWSEHIKTSQGSTRSSQGAAAAEVSASSPPTRSTMAGLQATWTLGNQTWSPPSSAPWVTASFLQARRRRACCLRTHRVWRSAVGGGEPFGLDFCL